MNIVATNIANGMLPANGRIELAFDRLLLPLSVVRQTFVLEEQVQGGNSVLLTPTPAYDPAARVVTLTPMATLDVNSPFTLTIVSPSGPTDPNGLRAIDGAGLAPSAQRVFGFMTTMPAAAAPTPQPSIDYCRDISPVLLAHQCAFCHDGTSPSGANGPGAGLALDSPADVQATAIGRVAQGSNTGPLAGNPEPPTLQFAEDMPIVDPGTGPSGMGAENSPGSGDPAHSWFMYKLLMAVAPLCDTTLSAGVAPCDGGVPEGGSFAVSIAGVYSVTCSDAGDPCPQPLPDAERERLAGMITGREMPPNPAGPLSATYPPGIQHGLSVDELERVSFWIAQGAPLPASCP
ncbi:MAG: hypothetical protein ABSC94_09060 [Polyangiaceae bacterium]